MMRALWLATSLHSASCQDLFLAGRSQECATRRTPSADPFQQMCYLALRNGQENDNYFAPPHRFHNHLMYELVALYKLGANASHLQAAYDLDVRDLAPAHPSVHFINESNWVAQIGAWQRGEVDNASVHFSDYGEFFRGKVRQLGPQAAVEMALPYLVDGVAADLFHPAIQLSYYYESNDPEILAEGLAWLATAYTELAPLHPSPSYRDIRRAAEALRADARLPSSVSVSELSQQFGGVMSEYDLLVGEAPSLDEVQTLVRHISLFVLDLFALDGYSSFTLLHVATATRAMQTTIARLANPNVQAQYLRRHWSAVLYYYVAQGRPVVVTPAITGPLPTWAELAAASISFTDTHLNKLVYLSRENHGLWSVPLYKQTAASAVALFQSGGGWVY